MSLEWIPVIDPVTVANPFYGVDRPGPPVRFSDFDTPQDETVFEIRVCRTKSGATAIFAGDRYPMSEFHEHRHAMLVDALVEVNKERDREQSRSG